MNRYISYCALVLVAAFVAACSSSEDMTGNEATGSESSNVPMTILGVKGNGVVSTGASYGEYTAFINVPGKWSVETTQGLANVYPSVGEGPTTAVVQVGENWGAMRENVLTLTTQGAGTRAAGDSDYKLLIVQAANPSLDSISKVFSANKGAGYSYMPGGEYCDGALIQLFNLVTLDSIQQATGVRLISDDIFPTTAQEYMTADSESGLTKGLTVNASAGMDFGSVKGKGGSGSVSVGVEKGHEEKSVNKYALKRLKNTQFTREIQYMNVDIAAAKGNTTKQYDICDKFLSEIGPCFISKSAMGTVLDYQISVDSTALRDNLGVEVALEVSFQKNIKASGGGTIDIGVSKEATDLQNKTTSTVKVRGGDVSQVCILVTGGKLDDSDVTAWMNSCTPTRAVMVDIALIPIYVLITDAYAREVLTNYFNLKLNN